MKQQIIPTPGKVIRHPDPPHDRLPREGITVDRVTAYWRRRERDGGVRIVDVASEKTDPTLTPGADDPTHWTSADGGPAEGAGEHDIKVDPKIIKGRRAHITPIADKE